VRRVGVFGWGVVAPRTPDIEAFARNLACSESWLTPFNGFGPDNFLVGTPTFDFAAYRAWIEERFPPSRFSQLQEKMDPLSLYAIGAFIQALGQNPGIEQELTRLGTSAHVYVATGIGNITTIHDASLRLYRAQRRWDRFWADPERNPPARDYLASLVAGAEPDPEVPVPPDSVPLGERLEAEDAWWHYWAGKAPGLAEYLAELRRIEGLTVEGKVESGKLRVMKQKQRFYGQLQRRWGAPDPPWRQVTANLLWNIHNTPAAQISMLGRITGLAFAPVGACSTFGLSLKLAMDSIGRGEAKAVVIGASDGPPHPLVVGAFHGARVISADGTVSKPLTGLRGTHVSGGSAIWIVGDYEHMTARGFKPLGMEPLAVGVSSDADHIITPSREGPLTAIEQALAEAGVAAGDIVSWDLHATATPGDFLEVDNLRTAVPPPAPVLVTARKGTFGHGMAACGGWELTAQYLGYQRGALFPTPLGRGELNREIAGVHDLFVFDQPCPAPQGPVGKLSMGVGGINACVISRPW
jgi:3-oxoacyl-(acyl-carrier-protein) synthase